MTTNETLQLLKFSLATELEKQGTDLMAFEQQLADINADNHIEKIAGIAGSLAGLVSNALTTVPGLVATSAIMGGGALGGMAYGGYHYMNNQDKKLKEEEDEVARIKFLTEQLKQEHGLK